MADFCRGRGHLPNPADARDYKLNPLIGAVSAPASIDYTKYIDQVRDQLQTDCCVAEALARALHIKRQLQGAISPKYPSVQATYAMARDFSNPGQPLVDGGTYPRNACRALQLVGVCSEDVMPFDPATINAQPSWMQLRAGIDSKLSAYYAIDPTNTLATALRQAMAAGYIPNIALLVGSDFSNFTGSGIMTSLGASTGGHMLCCAGYDSASIWIVNSWGTTWGNGGLARIADSVVNGPCCTDSIAVETA